jgi:hypothetical protein
LHDRCIIIRASHELRDLQASPECVVDKEIESHPDQPFMYDQEINSDCSGGSDACFTLAPAAATIERIFAAP